MPEASTKQVSQLKQITICVLFVIVVRINYAIVEAYSQSLYRWFANHTWRLIVLHLLAIPVSVGGAMAARKWFSSVLIIPTSIACGALVTLAYSSLTGGLIGAGCGILVFSSTLLAFARRLLRPTFFVWIPGLLLGTSIAFAVTSATIAADPQHRFAMLVGQWCVVMAVIVLATWLVMRSDATTHLRLVRCVIAMGFVLSILIGLLLGPSVESYVRIRQLGDVASIWMDRVPWSQVPSNGLWSVYGASIEGANEAQIAKLGGFPSIRWLTINNSKTSIDAISKTLAKLTQLEHVELCDVSIDAETIRAIANSKKVYSIRLRNTDVTDDAIEFLALMSSLRHLSIDGMHRNGVSLAPLAKLSGISSLVLNDMQLTDGDLADLAGLRGLRTLAVRNGNLTGSGLHHLQKHPRLSGLEVIDCPLEAKYIADLAPIKLNWLTLDGVPLNDAAAQAIGSMNSLGVISLRRTGVTDDQVKQFDRLQSPQLILDASRLSRDSRATLRGADEVELRVEQTTVAADDIQRLAELGIDVIFDTCVFTDGAAQQLEAHGGSPHFVVLNSNLSREVELRLNKR